MLRLRQSTGTAHIDDLLVAYLSLLDERFSIRLRSVYLSGSVATATADQLSDVDGLVILASVPSIEDQENFKMATSEWSDRSGMLLDFVLLADEELFGRDALPKKTESWVLIHGEEIRGRVPPLTVGQYIDAIMRGAFICFRHVRGSPDVLAFPLTYPDPDGEFFGYERRGFREIDGWRSAGTRALVNGVSLAATTLVAMQTGYCATSRGESFLAYREHVGGRWAPFLDDLHTRCRNSWSYRVPEDVEARHTLRSLCREVLTFENKYLLACIRYLRLRLSEVDETVVARAAETLGQISYEPGALPPGT